VISSLRFTVGDAGADRLRAAQLVGIADQPVYPFALELFEALALFALGLELRLADGPRSRACAM
jgi:hypothetical protein